MSEYEVEAIYATYGDGTDPNIYAIDHLRKKLNERSRDGWDPFTILPDRGDEGNGTIIGYEVVWVKRAR